MYLIDINVSAEIDEYPSLHFQDIRENPKCHGRTHGRTWKQYTPPQTKFARGIKIHYLMYWANGGPKVVLEAKRKLCSNANTVNRGSYMSAHIIWNRLYLEACKANDGTTGVDMMVVTLSGLEIKGAGQLAPKTTHIKTINILNNTRIMQRYTQRLLKCNPLFPSHFQKPNLI